MLNRYLSLAVLVCIAASMAVFGQNPGAEYLFQLPESNTTGQFVPYNALANPMTSLADTSGPNGITAVIPMPDGSKFYLIGANGVSAVDPTFQNFHGINLAEPSGLQPTITAATLTPNGNYLLIATLDANANDYLFLISTSTDQQLTGSSLPIQLAASAGPYVNNQGAPCPQCWIAVSNDSQTAYLLENSSFGGPTQIVAYSLSSFQKIGNAIPSAQQQNGFQGAGNGIVMAPQGVLYVSGNNYLLAINPVTLNQIGSTIPLAGFNASQLQFTPDGTAAYAINQVPRGPGAASLLGVVTSSNSVTYWPTTISNQAGPQLSAVFVAGNSNCPSTRCVFAYSSSLTTFFDVTPVTGGLSASVSTPSPTLSGAIVAGQTPCPNASSIAACILAATVSNEIPQSNYIYVLVSNGSQPFLDRISISSDTISVTNGSPVLTSGGLEFASIPTSGTATSFNTFNTTQTVNTGQTSIPLIAQALNTTPQTGASSLPVFNTAGTFSAGSTGLTINTPNVTSGSNGFVQTTVSVPSGGVTCPSGTCTVTLTLGGASTTFNIIVPGSASGGTGPGGGGTGGSTSPEVSIVGGDGQLVPLGTSATYPLAVQVTNSSGVPQSNVTVTWTVTSGGGAIGTTSDTNSVQTDVNGMAMATFFAESVDNPGFTFETDTIVASAPQGSATFFESAYAGPGGNISGIQPSLISPVPGQVIQVSPGSPATNAVQANISTIPFDGFVSAPVPDVGIILVDPNNLSNQSPVVSCQGQPLSDENGNVSCTIVTTCAAAPGLYGLAVSVGGTTPFEVGEVQITAGGGGAAQIAVVSGNNQSGNAGQQAALPLVVGLTTSCGAPITTGTITWAVTQGSAKLSVSSNSPNGSGQASNTVTFGNTPGTITITATINGGASVSFTLTSSVSVGSLNVVSGGGQSATEGQAFASPLIVSVLDSNKNPISGITVNFGVTTGSATVNPTSATTGANGQAQTTVTAGQTAGSVVVTATAAGGFSQTFSLTVVPPGPTITASSFVNAASGVAGLVPCGLGVVTGAGLATGIQGVVSGVSAFGPLPYTLAGLSMTINGVGAPIQAVSNQTGVQQVNFQTPCETPAGGSVTVVITINNNNTTIPSVSVLQAQPGIFTYPGTNNQPFAAVLSASNFAYVTPSNFAVRGQIYYVVVTGLGQTTPALLTNNPGDNADAVLVTTIVGVNNAGVQVVSATPFPGNLGAYLVGFIIPTSFPASSTPVPLSVAVLVNGNPVYSNNTFLAGIE
jgi:uncharacterized protein (TIGR03437 family)